MKKRLLTIGLSLAMTLCTASVALAAPKDPLYSINGGGTIFYPEELGGVKESYGLNAKQIDAQGNAKGQMQFSWHYTASPVGAPDRQQYLLHANVLYLVFDEETGDVWVGGEITGSNLDTLDFDGAGTGMEPQNVVGQTFHIRLHDGQFDGATDVDTIGMLWFCPFGDDQHTLEKHVFEKYVTPGESLFELTSGNITLRN